MIVALLFDVCFSSVLLMVFFVGTKKARKDFLPGLHYLYIVVMIFVLEF